MRGRAFAVEQTGRREDENAGADRHQSRSFRVRRSQRFQDGLGRRFFWAPPPRNHDRPGLFQSTEPAAWLHADAAQRADRATLQRADLEVVPIDAKLRPRQSEHLDHDSELEGAEAVVSERGYPPGVPGWHGRILAHIGISAYRLDSHFRRTYGHESPRCFASRGDPPRRFENGSRAL